MRINSTDEYRDLDIAVIGMDGRFPGAKNCNEFWNHIRSGRESLTWLTDDELRRAGVSESRIRDPHYVKAAFKLAGVENFDAAFFGFTPKEAMLMDPQLRLLLETSWHALEDAGYAASGCGGRVGVFVGASTSQYLMRNILPNYGSERIDEMRSIWIGNDLNYLATMISYKLDLTGPSINVQSACSTSLAAVAMACQSLMNYECDMALAGGCKVAVPQDAGYTYVPGEILSPDGHCRPFDVNGHGTVLGNGVGMAVLKRLREAVPDHDRIIAVIRGSAVNNDGSSKAGYTAPSVTGECRAIRDALLLSEADAGTITYMEAHGTATELGDPIEIQALTEAFGSSVDKKQFCALGTVKANIGHLDTASGIAGFIKTCLALEKGELPPCINYEAPNKNINFEDTPFYVNTRLSKWEPECGVRRAGVSSFGFGGTNVHTVLEEAREERVPHSRRAAQLLLLSAKSPGALERTAANLADFLRNNADADYRNAIFTMNTGRRPFEYRSFLVCKNREELISKLGRISAPTRRCGSGAAGTVFMFPGQGVQYIGMAGELYETEPVFREEITRCASFLKDKTHYDLLEILFHSEMNEGNQKFLSETFNTHVAMFAVEYAAAKLLMSWGIAPAAMIGHSIGEYVAACISGVMTLETALALVAERGRIIRSLPRGAMLSINMGAREAAEYCEENISLAVDNTDTLSVLSGKRDDIGRLAEMLQKRTKCRILHTSHAFHSYMMEEGAEQFRKALENIKFGEPQIPYISNVTGDWIRREDAADPEYWVRHMTGTVRFREGAMKLKDAGFRYFFEAGPGNTLSTFLRQNLRGMEDIAILNTVKGVKEAGGDEAYLFNALGSAWALGMEFDPKAFYQKEELYRISLPGYPFNSTVHWVNAPRAGTDIQGANIGTDRTGAEVQGTDAPGTGRTRNDAQSTGSGTGWTSEQSAEGISFCKNELGEELPENRAGLSAGYVPPENSLEESLAEILEDVMGIRPIGVTDNFIELGGHSLIAAQVISRIRDMFNLEIDLKQFMDKPTVRQVADWIFDQLASSGVDEPEEIADDSDMAGISGPGAMPESS